MDLSAINTLIAATVPPLILYIGYRLERRFKSDQEAKQKEQDTLERKHKDRIQFELDGIGHIVASFGVESGLVPYTGYMAKQSYIDKNGDVLERFTKALYNAQQWVESSSTGEIARSIQPFFNDTPIEIIESVVERYKSQGSYATTPKIQEEAWNNLHIIMDQAGELPMSIDYNTLVNPEFADKVLK